MLINNGDQENEESSSKEGDPTDSHGEQPLESSGAQDKIDDMVTKTRQKKQDLISQEEKKKQDSTEKDQPTVKRILTKETPTRFDEPITQQEINALIKKQKEKDGHL